MFFFFLFLFSIAMLVEPAEVTVQRRRASPRRLFHPTLVCEI